MGSRATGRDKNGVPIGRGGPPQHLMRLLGLHHAWHGVAPDPVTIITAAQLQLRPLRRSQDLRPAAARDRIP